MAKALRRFPSTVDARGQPHCLSVTGKDHAAVMTLLDLSLRPTKLEVSGAELSQVLAAINVAGGWVSGMTAGVGKKNSVYVLTIHWPKKEPSV